MSHRIESVRRAVEAMHECSARYECSFPVIEKLEQETVWEGFVDSFLLSEHPKAKRCYAWMYMDGEEPRYVAVLEIPPVTTPQLAVRVAIASGQQK